MKNRKNRISLVLISGLSGAGKSSAARALEDHGFFMIDNLPMPLVTQLVENSDKILHDRGEIVLVADIRTPEFVAKISNFLPQLRRRVINFVLIFLEASLESIVKRFAQTRRPHTTFPYLPLYEAIKKERDLLSAVRAVADIVLDTTNLNVHELRSVIVQTIPFIKGSEKKIISLTSFGFKFGIPLGTDLLFDVRYLPNPYYLENLRKLSGRDKEVIDFLLKSGEFTEIVERVYSFVEFLLPRYERSGKRSLSVAIGCTGGKHRAVAVVEKLASKMRSLDGWNIEIFHRDIDRE